MKKLLFVIFFLFFYISVYVPNYKHFDIISNIPIEPYNTLITSIGIVEGKLDTLAYNSIEKATGYFQIRPIRLKDYNKRTGNNYQLADMFNYQIAEKIFLYYADSIGPYNFEKIAKNWNGSGPMTISYWKKVQKELNKLNGPKV